MLRNILAYLLAFLLLILLYIPVPIIIKPGSVDIELFSPLAMAGLQENDLAEWIQNLQQKIYQDKNHENH